MEASAIYGLESQARALCSHINDAEGVTFFAGTLSTRSEGQVHQIDFEDESNSIKKKVYKPKVGEIWQISPCPSSLNVIGLCFNQIGDFSSQMKCGLFNLPDSESNQSELTLKTLIEFGDDNCQNFDWHPNRNDTIAIVLKNSVVIWAIDGECPKEKSRIEVEGVDGGKWNPHLDGNQFAVMKGANLIGIDGRSKKEVWEVKKTHKYQMRDFDFNPNKQYYVATSGEDCTVRFWDIRNPNEALKAVECHSHWIWRVRYNTFHDQLVLTSGSDSRVFLHSQPLISSEPNGRAVFSDGEEDEKIPKPALEEGILGKYEEHEDAIYAVEWSNYDPWIFASLSYDGRLVINKVPKSQKYKILL